MRMISGLACMVLSLGCATASPSTEVSEPASPSAEEWFESFFNVEEETAISYLQLSAWRLDAAIDAALEATDDETRRAILEEGQSDATRLRHEYTIYWETSDHNCYYCGPVCLEMNGKLMGEEALANQARACSYHCCWTPPT